MTGRAPLAQPLTLDCRLLTVRHAGLGRELLGVPSAEDLARVRSQLEAVQALANELKASIEALVPKIVAEDGKTYRLVLKTVDGALLLDWEVMT
jgi:hypothetical protein